MSGRHIKLIDLPVCNLPLTVNYQWWMCNALLLWDRLVLSPLFGSLLSRENLIF